MLSLGVEEACRSWKVPQDALLGHLPDGESCVSMGSVPRRTSRSISNSTRANGSDVEHSSVQKPLMSDNQLCKAERQRPLYPYKQHSCQTRSRQHTYQQDVSSHSHSKATTPSNTIITSPQNRESRSQHLVQNMSHQFSLSHYTTYQPNIKTFPPCKQDNNRPTSKPYSSQARTQRPKPHIIHNSKKEVTNQIRATTGKRREKPIPQKTCKHQAKKTQNTNMFPKEVFPLWLHWPCHACMQLQKQYQSPHRSRSCTAIAHGQSYQIIVDEVLENIVIQ